MFLQYAKSKATTEESTDIEQAAEAPAPAPTIAVEKPVSLAEDSLSDHERSSAVKFCDGLRLASSFTGRDSSTSRREDVSIDASNSKKPRPSFRDSMHATMQRGFSQLFGTDNSFKESKFVIIMGAIIAFNMGFVNGSCLSGFLNPDGARQSVAGTTGGYTISALSLAGGNIRVFGDQSCLILSYMFGCFLPGFMTPEGKPYQMEPSYGPAFLLAGVFMLASSVLAFYQQDPLYIFCCATAANGVQNGVASIYSANLIRVSTTGATTDVCLYLGQWMRTGKHTKEVYKRLVLAMILMLFWLGAMVSYYASKAFLANTLFINAALFWVIGFSLIYFLVKEIGISIQAAMLGSWKWKNAMAKIAEHNQRSSNGKTLEDIFDDIDEDDNGEIDASELFSALVSAGVSIKKADAKVLIRAADKDRNGTIDRDEWNDLVNQHSHQKINYDE